MNCIIAILTSSFENVKHHLRNTPSYTSESYVFRWYKYIILCLFELERDTRCAPFIGVILKCFCCGGARSYHSEDDDVIVEGSIEGPKKRHSRGSIIAEMISESKTSTLYQRYGSVFDSK